MSYKGGHPCRTDVRAIRAQKKKTPANEDTFARLTHAATCLIRIAPHFLHPSPKGRKSTAKRNPQGKARIYAPEPEGLGNPQGRRPVIEVGKGLF